MGTLKICAVVIALSVFADTVQNLYGWSNVTPAARGAFAEVNDWAGHTFGWKLDLEETAANEAVAGEAIQSN